MFRRFVVVVLVVALLCAPVSAYVNFKDDFDSSISSVWNHRVSGGSSSVSDGIASIWTDSGSLVKRWNWYQYPNPLSGTYECHFRLRLASGPRTEFGLLTGTSPAWDVSTRNGIYVVLWDTAFNVNYFTESSQSTLIGAQSITASSYHLYKFRVEGTVLKFAIDDADWRVLTTTAPASMYPTFGIAAWEEVKTQADFDYVYVDPDPLPPASSPDEELVSVYVLDDVTGLPLDDYHLAVAAAGSGDMLVDESFMSSPARFYLPRTSPFQGHFLHATADGYDQVPAQMMFNVPSGGRNVTVRMTPLTGSASDGNVILSFNVSAGGGPLSDALVTVRDGASYRKTVFTGVSGVARFEVPENTTYDWIVNSFNYEEQMGEVVVGTADISIPVTLVRTPEGQPRPPNHLYPFLPEVSPVLDPASFRSVIEDVPYLGDMAVPLLDCMEDLVDGVDETAMSVIGTLIKPAQMITSSVETVCDQVIETSEEYASLASYLLDSLAGLINVIPAKVINLVTFGMLLDIVILLLRGGL